MYAYLCDYKMVKLCITFMYIKNVTILLGPTLGFLD